MQMGIVYLLWILVIERSYTLALWWIKTIHMDRNYL